jgi:methionyl-tRNA synthetase
LGIAETTTAGGGFYITTAINYTNGPAHMGHAYEAATADVIARFQRLKGTHPAYFVTGADEHGQKIANTAADLGMEPLDICNKVRQKSLVIFKPSPRNQQCTHFSLPRILTLRSVCDWVPSVESANLGFQ